MKTFKLKAKVETKPGIENMELEHTLPDFAKPSLSLHTNTGSSGRGFFFG